MYLVAFALHSQSTRTTRSFMMDEVVNDACSRTINIVLIDWNIYVCWQHALADMSTPTVLSMIECTVFILQVETLQYYHLYYHFSAVTCRDTKSSDLILLENIFRIQLQGGYRKWHHCGLDRSARTRMGHKILGMCCSIQNGANCARFISSHFDICCNSS